MKIIAVLVVIFFVVVVVTDSMARVVTPVAITIEMCERYPWTCDDVQNWVLGEETDGAAGILTDGLAGLGVMNVGTIAFNGYSGPESFVCANLIPDLNAYITSGYGDYRSPTYSHSGIDFGTNYSNGHEVITPMGGEVVFVGIYGGWGYTVIIENNGYQVLLTHASEVLVTVGQIVQAGDVVMNVGGQCVDARDGNSTGPHLHFEVRICDPETQKCQAVNPMAVILPGQSGFCNWQDISGEEDHD
jgi:murein DD-endopeptidase MepM/ murein hydrolase activator NlpD